MGRVLAIDYGSKRIGLAISDETKTIAQLFPPVLVKTEDQALEDIAAVVSRENVEKLLIGMPLNLRGKNSKQTAAAKEFSRKLQRKLPHMAVEFIDERFTTRQAQDELQFLDLDDESRKGMVDSMSACILLRGYLKKTKNHVSNHSSR